jgi:hypothetical protein
MQSKKKQRSWLATVVSGVNCQEMVAYIDKAHRANQNWRRTFYNTYVKGLGLSEGALVSVKARATWRSPEVDGVGIVTSINWDEISMFCSKPHGNRWVDGNYRQKLMVKVRVGEEEYFLAGNEMAHIDDELVHKNNWGFNVWSDATPNLVNVLSPSTTPLGEEWIEEGHRKSLEFLTKKRSLEKLDDDGVTDWINQWL